MRPALALVAVVMVVCASLVAASPSPAALLSGAPGAWLLAVIPQAIARGMSRFVLGYPSQRGGVRPPAYRRLLAVAAGTLAAMYLTVAAAPTGVRWLVELGYCVVLAGAGIALARWCRSSEQSPVLLATGIVILVSAGTAPASGIDIAAARSAARVLMRLPLDASVLWAAWHVAAVRGRSA